MDKRLYRSRKDRKLAGVCGGIAEYFKIDPVFVRVAFIVLVFCSGAGLIAYGAFWIVTPEAPESLDETDKSIK